MLKVHKFSKLDGIKKVRMLPTLQLFKIGVKLDMVETKKHDVKPSEVKKEIKKVDFVATEEDKEFIRQLQKDFEIVDRPFLNAANELGINVAGIVAALGIVGLAMAFAAQDTIENIIAGVFLMVDRPFREGDRILLPKKIGSLYSSWGDVIEVGLRTTRVRSTDGVLLTIPNKSLTKDTIANFNHKDDRNLRVRIRLGLVPTWENVSKGEEIVENIAKSHEDICQEKPKPPQIVLRDFGDQEVIMEIRYYVPNAPLMRTKVINLTLGK